MERYSVAIKVRQANALLDEMVAFFSGVISTVFYLSTQAMFGICKHPFAALLYFLFALSLPQLLMAHVGKESEGQKPHQHKEIRIVMSGAFVSEAGIGVYDEISDYLAKKLEREVSFITGFSYSTINSMLDSGMADIGFICGLPYVMMHDEPQSNIELLLAPVMKSKKYHNKPKYYSYVIVQKESKFASFSDLKGSTYVYNDEISNSGYNMPRAKLIEMGETSGFFGKVLRSGSHEESIRMVALGEADASAVDSLVYDYDMAKNPEFTQQTKILEVLGPAGIPPVVISSEISPPLRKKISDTLLGMKDDPVGAKILEQALVDRFTVVDDSNYDDVRKMRQQAQDSGFQEIR
jgi:phosphonate transport system substrate-binding protein